MDAELAALEPALDIGPQANPVRIARHFRRALLDARRLETPYRHWRLVETLPEWVAVGLISLPIAPLLIDDCGGVRDLDNSKRTFLTPETQADFPVCAMLAQALQRPEVVSLAGETCGFHADGSYLRVEYIQDIDGAWLKPHCDVPQKLCSMVVYLCTGPHAKDWGTDIYDENVRPIGRSSADFNSATIFIPGANTWHGFEKRPIHGVRRLLEINYVHPSWRDRDQLCFPDQPCSTAPDAC
jgi:hypothetical protein